MSATPEELFARLAGLGIETETREHAPVYTVEEAKRLRGEIPGAHCKNLLLRDHKKVMWLVVAREGTAVDLKALRDRLGSGRLSFASPDRLKEALGLEPGAVTPFGLINDTACTVNVILEKRMMEADRVNYHPLTNTATTTITPDGLLRFIESCGHTPRILDL